MVSKQSASVSLPTAGDGQPRSLLRAWLLLLLKEQPDYGYDLLERLRPLGIGEGDPGGVYRALRALEHDGLVTSRWNTSGSGPARRNYELTTDGEQHLHEWCEVIEQSRALLDCYLQRCAAATAPADGHAGGGRREDATYV